MVAEWDCIVRNLLRVADGRVKPVHDVGGKSRYFRRLVLYQPPLLLTYSAQRSNPVMTVLGLDPRINPVISIGWLLNGIASFAICYG